MKLNLNGVEIELPNNAQVDVSEDGKRVRIGLSEPQVEERIRVVEVPGPERIVERIRVVEVEKPCTQPHYPTWPYQQPYVTWTVGGDLYGNQMIGGSTSGGVVGGMFDGSSNIILHDGHTITCSNSGGSDYTYFVPPTD